MMIKKNDLLLALAILVVTTLSYLPSFQAEFQFDDKDFIVDNHKIRDITDLHAIWQSRPIPSSRFIPFLTFALNYHFSRLDVFAYHLTNFFFHLLTVALVWWLASQVVGLQARSRSLPSDKERKSTGGGPGSSIDTEQDDLWRIPFATAVIYALHPVQTQAVTYISQRMALLATLFYVLSVCLYILLRTPGLSGWRKALACAGSLIAAVLAMLSKEIAITLPLMLLFVECFVIQRLYADKLQERKLIIASLLGVFLLLTAIILSLFGFKIKALLFSERISESHHGDILTLPRYLLTQARVWMTFLRLMVLPLQQNVDYDFPMSTSPVQPWTTWASIGCLSALVIFAFCQRHRRPLVTFGLFWFVITLLANLVPRRHVIFEHKMYLSSIGLCLIIALLIFHLFRQPRQFLLAVTLLAAVFGFLTFQRNTVWRSEVTLWEDILKKSPDKIRVNNNLGTLYFERGEYDRALEYFNKALSVNPDYASANNNRGAVYIEKGLLDLALKDVERAIALEPRYASAYKNRGDVLKKKGQTQAALEMYDQALNLDPYFIDGYDVRGIVYGELGDYEKALSDFDQALQLNPQHAGALHNKGTVFMRQGKKQAALALFNRAIANDAGNPDTYRNRGNIHQDLGQDEAALQDYNRALQLNPVYKEAYNSRGVLYARMGDLESALADFQLALRIDPSYPDAHNNIGMVYKLQKKMKEALGFFNQAIRLNPRYASAYYNRSLVYFEQGVYPEALKDADQAKTLGYPINEKYYYEIQKRMDQ
jgi:tetratricopeptide (TPR) repeat protein